MNEYNDGDCAAKPEDMARALLQNAIQSRASMTVWTALAKNCRTVYICGGVFEHQLPRDLFFFFFEGLAIYFGKVTTRVRLNNRRSNDVGRQIFSPF